MGKAYSHLAEQTKGGTYNKFRLFKINHIRLYID